MKEIAGDLTHHGYRFWYHAVATPSADDRDSLEAVLRHLVSRYEEAPCPEPAELVRLVHGEAWLVFYDDQGPVEGEALLSGIVVPEPGEGLDKALAKWIDPVVQDWLREGHPTRD